VLEFLPEQGPTLPQAVTHKNVSVANGAVFDSEAIADMTGNLTRLVFEMHPSRGRLAKRTQTTISFYEKNKTPKGVSAARDDDRIDVFLV